MKIDIRNDKVVYITIGDYEYYIDDSTDEQIMVVHNNQDSKSYDIELNTHQKNMLIAEFIGHRSVLKYHNDWNYLIEAVDRVQQITGMNIPKSFNQNIVYNNVVTLIQLVDKKQPLVEKM
ncbi:MAG: hypothetical protein Unbinned2299contig1000_50 [Prokaryotic dsDNA virus sp.]|nr:MAG: hypothetical protein Unbinned2299contig1000_50 [Prokaryotic dsDNA virus sp.]|tara:strand:+ start:567 stop:926 length:360 start_codon:yes stop_codon:yes gene_type:complete